MHASPYSLTIAGKTYRSRLLVGTGKYQDFAATRAAIDASGAEIPRWLRRQFMELFSA